MKHWAKSSVSRAVASAALVVLGACGNDYSSAEQDAGAAATPEGGTSNPTGDGQPSTATAFCTKQSSPTFCSDFDDGKLPGPWSQVLVKNGGAVKIENHGFVARFAVSTGGAAASVVRTGLPVPKKTFDFSADVVVQDKGAADLDVLIARLPTTSDPNRELQITVFSTGKLGLVPYLNGATKEMDDLGTYTPDHTFHVALHVDVAAKRASVTIDGKSAGKGIDFEPANLQPQIFVGDSTTAVTAIWTVRYDDVLLQID